MEIQMPDKDDQIDLSVLNTLDAVTRAKVNKSLKDVLEHHLVENALDPEISAAEHTRESGPFHSKDHTRADPKAKEHIMLERIEGMDDVQFQKFSERLSKLKGNI
ncbi:hypothetical protein ACTFP3_22830 [Bacillus cereus group sp. MYBK5-2]|uniref:hypothetical protein n=1 Tax=Bacillus cereus group sp. MYBK5-2 TaxID=3450622 RepID=UPI003F79EA15